MQKREEKAYNGSIRLRIDSKQKKNGGRESYVAEQYYKLPLQVMTPFYQDSDGTVSLYLLNPSGGMLEYDNFLIDVTVSDGAKAHLLTPSANKVYRRKAEGIARQKNRFTVGAGSTLEYLPDEMIPFKDSAFYQETSFYLKRDSRLITWDIMAAGRTARGEIFDFYQYSSYTNIYVENELLMVDRMKVFPAHADISSQLCMKDYLFLATVYAYSEKECTEELAWSMREQLGKSSDGIIGISCPEPGLIVVKVLENHMHLLHDKLRVIWSLLRAGMLQKDIMITRKY